MCVIYSLKLFDELQTSSEEYIDPQYFYETVTKDKRNNLKKVSSLLN